MRASVLEEAHELLDALDADDPAKVAEELGDLLLQVALLTQIATEEGRFRFPEVIAHIVEPSSSGATRTSSATRR